MKRFLIFIVCLMVFKQGYSQVIDLPFAKKIAENYFDREAHDTTKAKYRLSIGKNIREKLNVKQSFSKYFNGHTSYFVNNIEGGGWVIISADKKSGPVIAYSENGSYDTLSLPPVIKDWMAQYDTIIEKRRSLSVIPDKKNKKWKKLEESTTNTLKQAYVPKEYLVKSFWHQQDPYNKQVPHSTTECGTCPAGCVCIALSQIINYWAFATGNTADFEFWNMPNILNISSPQSQIDATSYMIKIIGDDKLESDYCDGGCQTSHPVTTSIFSSTPGVGDVLCGLGYYQKTLEYHDCTWYTYNGWLNLIKYEIDAKRPVFYRYIGKHSFICDGYDDTNGNLHFNIGWGTSYINLWSDYEDLNVNGNDFTDMGNHACITGIMPDIDIDNTLNTALNSGENKTWQVKNNLIANSVIVNSGAKCQLVGGNNVRLLPGSWAKRGSKLTVKAYTKGSLSGNYKSALIINDTSSSISTQEYSSVRINPNVYPNPAHGEIIFDATVEGNGSYQVFDFKGKVVVSGTIATQQTLINLHNVVRGMYMLRVYFNNQYYLFKIINQ